jgi:hypothetical protein
VNAVETRHCPIEQGDVRRIRRKQDVNRGLPVIRHGHEATVALEQTNERIARCVIIFRHDTRVGTVELGKVSAALIVTPLIRGRRVACLK